LAVPIVVFVASVWAYPTGDRHSARVPKQSGSGDREVCHGVSPSHPDRRDRRRKLPTAAEAFACGGRIAPDDWSAAPEEIAWRQELNMVQSEGARLKKPERPDFLAVAVRLRRAAVDDALAKGHPELLDGGLAFSTLLR